MWSDVGIQFWATVTGEKNRETDFDEQSTRQTIGIKSRQEATNDTGPQEGKLHYQYFSIMADAHAHY